jgi:threonine dehydratase
VLADRWNISMFHYRNHGADHGKILAGFQVPKNERKSFMEALGKIGYSYEDVTRDRAYQSFLAANK